MSTIYKIEFTDAIPSINTDDVPTLAIYSPQGELFVKDVTTGSPSWKKLSQATLVNNAPQGQPTITGTAQVGQTLTVSTAAISDIDGIGGAIGVQWLADNVPISGANASTYLLTSSELGKTIKARASYTDNRGNNETIDSNPTAVVIAAHTNTPASGSVIITGTAQVGQTLAVNASNIFDPDGIGTLSYQWKANGTNISGATGVTYLLTSNELNKTITCTASFTDGFGSPEAVTSAATSSVIAAAPVNQAPTGAPVITGTAQQGQTLTCVTTSIADGNGLGAFSYQWKANGTNISGATSSTYVLTASEVTKFITVTVSYTDGAGFAESLTSAATAAVTASAYSNGIDLVPIALTYVNGVFTCTVQNMGNTALGPYVAGSVPYIGVAYYVDGVKQAWGLTNAGIGANGATVVVGTGSSPLYMIPDGSHTISAIVDDLSLISETSESNNTISVPITIGTGGGSGAAVAAAILADMYQTTSPTLVMAPSDYPAHGIESWTPSQHAYIEYPMPSYYSAMIGWAGIYRASLGGGTTANDTNTRVAVKDFRGWILKTDGSWVQVHNVTPNSAIAGDRWPENFSGATIGNATRVESDTSYSQYMQHGYVWHFFANSRVTVDPATTVGVVIYYYGRLVLDNINGTDDRAAAKYVMTAGGDWWRSLTAPHIAYNADPNLTNAAEIGWSKLKLMTNDWQPIFFTNIAPATLAANPPPITI